MSSPSFSIRSIVSDREVVFLNPRHDYFDIEVRGFHVRANRQVCAYTDAWGVSRLLSRLATYRNPWTTAERWKSLEGEFELSAVCSSTGHVYFELTIQENFGGPDEWKVTVALETTMGQLPEIASSAKSFFEIVAGP